MMIRYNGEPREIPAGATIQQLLDDLKLPARQVAVEVNFDVIPRERHAEHKLQADDQVEVVTLVGGG